MTYSEFAEAIEPLYRQFRFKMPEDWKAKDLGDRYRVLGKFSVEAMNIAVDKLLLSESHMPVPRILRQALIDASLTIKGESVPDYEPWDDANHCPCGCGGERWSQTVIDKRTGEPRYFPADILDGAMALITAGETETAKLRAEIVRGLAGKIMTRDFVDCNVHSRTKEYMRGTFLREDSRGVRVYRHPEQVGS